MKFYFAFSKKKLQVLHHWLVIWGIVSSNPSDLLININTLCIKKILVLTFDVILRRSVINKKQWAKCSPVCRPGSLWNPMRSALSWSFFLDPDGVFSSTASIQWAVTAINEVWFGSDHASVVKEIFPTDFYNIISILSLKENNMQTIISSSSCFM